MAQTQKKKIHNSSLKAGSLEQKGEWQNTGDLFAGGYHSWYSADTRKKNPFDPLKYLNLPDTFATRAKHPIMPAPGPQLFVMDIPKMGKVMFGYNEAGQQIVINDADKGKMSKNLQKVKGYGDGPLTMQKISEKGRDKPGRGPVIAFTSGLAGSGWIPTRVDNAQEYIAAFGGLNRLGEKSGAWGGWDDPRAGSKSNLAGDIFLDDGKINASADDTASKIGQQFLGMGINILLDGLVTGVEALANIATGGLAEIAFAALQPAIDMGTSALSDKIEGGIRESTGMNRMSTDYSDLDDYFGKAITPEGVPTNTDANFIKDDRVRVERKKYTDLRRMLNGKMNAMAAFDPKLSYKENQQKHDHVYEMRKELGPRSAELTQPVHFATQNRDWNLDYKSWDDMVKVNAKLQYVIRSVDSASTALKIRDQYKKVAWGSAEKSEIVHSVLKNILPPKNADPDDFTKIGNETAKTAAKLSNTFYDEFDTKHKEFQQTAEKQYEHLINESLGVEGDKGNVLFGNILSADDYQRFEKMKSDGQATEHDLQEFRRQKVRAWRNHTGTKIDLKNRLKSDKTYSKEYGKLYKRDKKDRFTKYFDSIDDNEVKRLEHVESEIAKM